MKLNSVTANSKWASFLFQIELKQHYEFGVQKFILFIDSFVFAHGKPVTFLVGVKLETLERPCIFTFILPFYCALRI